MWDLISCKYMTVCVGVAECINKFKDSEKGVTAVEYAIVIAGVAAVVAVIFGSGGKVETMLTGIFDNVESTVTQSMSQP